MNLSLKGVTLVIYVMLGLSIFTSFPRNEYTIGWYTVLFIAYVFGLLLLLGAHYILPRIFSSWNFCGCTVYKRKYIVCYDTMRSTEVRVFALLKIIPRQPVADMEKDMRDQVLATFSGVLSSANAGLAFIPITSTYDKDIRDRIEQKIAWKSLFGKSRKAQRDIQKLDMELRLLSRMPTLFEGFYIGIVSVTGLALPSGIDRDTIRQLEDRIKSVKDRLKNVGLIVKEIEGEELNNIGRYIFLGDINERTFF